MALQARPLMPDITPPQYRRNQPYDPRQQTYNPAQTSGGAGIPNIPGGPPPLNVNPYLDALYSARSGLVNQQQSLLTQFGGSLRNAIFAASPELAASSKYLTGSFAKPIPDDLAAQYRENIRAAQVFHGFEGGTSTGEQEAYQLTGLAEQRRQQLLPQMEQFGAGILQQSGLAAPTTPGLSEFAALNQQQLGYSQLQQSQYEFQQNLAFQQRQFEENLLAGRQQSDFARQQYKDTQARLADFDKFFRKPTVQSLREDYRTQLYQDWLNNTLQQQGGYAQRQTRPFLGYYGLPGAVS